MKNKSVKFTSYSIKKLLLDRVSEKANKKDKDFNICCEYFQNKDDKNLFCVNMKIVASTEKERVELIIEGYFQFEKDFEEEIKKQFLKINAPTILYPYCRTFISTITSFDNESMLLPIVNFYDLHMEREEE